jgi:hypothetical protein
LQLSVSLPVVETAGSQHLQAGVLQQGASWGGGEAPRTVKRSAFLHTSEPITDTWAEYW